MAAPRRRLRVRREPAATDPVRCDRDPLHCRCGVGPLPAPSRAPEIPAFISQYSGDPPPSPSHAPQSTAFLIPYSGDPRPCYPIHQAALPSPPHALETPAFITPYTGDPPLFPPCTAETLVSTIPYTGLPCLHHLMHRRPLPSSPQGPPETSPSPLHSVETPTSIAPYTRDPHLPQPIHQRPLRSPSQAKKTPHLHHPYTPFHHSPHQRPPPHRHTPQTPLHAVQGEVTAFIARCPQAAYPASSSLLSWVRLGSPGVQARHTLPTSLQHSLQYWAPQAGTGQTRSWGVTGTPHTVQLWCIQRHSRGQRRQHHSSSNLPCSGAGTLWGSGQAATPQGNRPGIRGQ